MRQLLITGASGFIGRALFARLRPLNPIGIRFQSKPDCADADIVSADLREEETVRRLLDQYQPDVIFHLAALVSPQFNEENPELATELHLKVTENILKSMDSASHIIFPSTDKVFDGTALDPDEEAATGPQGLYGQLKLQCEQLIKDQVPKFHIFRLPIVHALGDPLSLSFVDKALIELKDARTVEAFHNVKRCFVKLEELIDVFELSIHDTHYGIYHVGTAMMSYYDRLRALCEENQIAWEGRLLPTAGQAIPLAQNLNTQRIKTIFGYSFS